MSKERTRREQFLTVIRADKEAFYRYAYSVLQNQADAEDALSEAVVKAFAHLDNLKSIKKMRSWFFSILANTCKTMYIKRKQTEPLEEWELTAKEYVNLEENMDLLSCVSELDERFREVVMLFYFEDMKVGEIARILEVSEGTVKSRLSRARMRLKDLLKL